MIGCGEPEELVRLIFKFAFQFQVLRLQRPAGLVPVHGVLSLCVDRDVWSSSQNHWRRCQAVHGRNQQVPGACGKLFFETRVRLS